jgi:TIR domain-containing protein
VRGRWSSSAQVAAIVKQCLGEGKTVEIDGLGSFRPDGRCGYQFVPRSLPKVFIAYVQEDAPQAERLFCELAKRGFAPWLDRRKLMPGQNWPRSIEDAIETSDFFVACFSTRSVTKKGGFQAEIRWALDCARRIPLDEIFVIPVRLDGCHMPPTIQRELQYIDLFPHWSRGLRKLLTVMERQMGKRGRLAG